MKKPAIAYLSTKDNRAKLLLLVSFVSSVGGKWLWPVSIKTTKQFYPMHLKRDGKKITERWLGLKVRLFDTLNTLLQ